MRLPRFLQGGSFPRARAFDPHEVTHTDPGHPEEAPERAGLDRAGVDAIWASVVDCYRTGLYPAVALCLRRGGHVVIDRAIGHARGNAPTDPPDAPLVPATPATLFNIFSASKMITAMLVHMLAERGLVHIEDHVARYVPNYGNGKEWTTLRHVLTHRAGIPAMPPGTHDMDLLVDPQRVIPLLAAAKPVSIPGRRLAYHALTGGYVLAEVVRHASGLDVRQLLRQEVLDPLGMSHLGYGVRPDELPLVAHNALTGPPPPRLAAALFRRSLGVDYAQAADISNDPRALLGIVPSGNIIGTAEEACRFMELLLRGGTLGGVRIFAERTVREALREQSYLEVDLTLALPVRYGMGFMLGGRFLSPFGMGTPRAFGHIGFTNVVMYADPDRDVSVSLMTSGKPFLALGELEWYGIMQMIARVCAR